MKKLIIMAMVLALLTGSAMAAEFVPSKCKDYTLSYAQSAGASTRALGCQFKERDVSGLVTYRFTADCRVTYQCVDSHGNCVPGTQESVETLTATLQIPAKRNGTAQGTITLAPSESDLTCDNVQVQSVTYTNVVLTDETNGVSIGLQDKSPVFFNCQ